jgi:hypothetical protein
VATYDIRHGEKFLQGNKLHLETGSTGATSTDDGISNLSEITFDSGADISFTIGKTSAVTSITMGAGQAIVDDSAFLQTVNVGLTVSSTRTFTVGVGSTLALAQQVKGAGTLAANGGGTLIL